MEDISRRTEYHNVMIQIQAVDKLYNEVKKKKDASQPLSTGTPEFLELRYFWQYVDAEQDVVARHCCRLWIQLLHERNADFTYVLNGFLNKIPLARNLSGIVESVTELLALQVILKTNAEEPFSCPYSIRSPPHPYITLLNNRPEQSWPLILEKVHRLFEHPQKCVREHVLTVLDPFLKFVLLEPKSSEQFASLRSSLKVRLISIATYSEDNKLKNACFEYQVDMMSKMHMSSVKEITETSQFCVQLLWLYESHASDFESFHGDRLTTFALTLCLKNQLMNLDYFFLIQALLKISKRKIKVPVLSSAQNVGLLSELLLLCYPAESIPLLALAKEILKTGRDHLSHFCIGLVAMAVINLLATPLTVTMTATHKLMTSLASEIILLLPKCSATNAEKLGQHVTEGMIQLTGEAYQIYSYVQLSNMFSKDRLALIQWLRNLEKHIPNLNTIPKCLTNLLVSVFLLSDGTEEVKMAVDRLMDVVKKDPSQGLCVLPVCLFALGNKSCPTMRLHILYALPKLATHKFNIAPVLKTIQSLYMYPQLKSVSIKLMTDLWILQDRCFLYLQKMITDSSKGCVSMTTVVDDVTLARAMAIKVVCQQRAEQHGAEMLAPLSDLINICINEKSALAAALALEALFYICQAEVIDLMSAWKVLGNKIIKETRTVVIEKICSLLSLVPVLKVKGEEYEVFQQETVRYLWLYTQSEAAAVVSAAYKALSKYSMDLFRLSHFKYKVVEDFVIEAQTILDQSKNEDDNIDSVMPYVPGICYIRLLQEMKKPVLDGYAQLLSSFISEEVSNLPRGIYYMSHRQQSSFLNRALTSIPGFILSKYDKTSQPGLKQSLASALLCCYDPSVEVSRDGRPRKHYILSHGKRYQQMFKSLLQDVMVQPSDWNRTTVMVQAWLSFMERLFGSMLQARNAEIDIQLSMDVIEEEEAKVKKTSAWFLVRDSIVDDIKKASKENPSMQFNAILALAGLAIATQNYVTSLDKEDKTKADTISEYKTHYHWLMTVIDTCMSIVDTAHIPKSSLIGLCQQRAVDDRLPASVLAQASAICALSHLASIIMGSYIELIDKIVTTFTEHLPGQTRINEIPPILQFFYGFGLGHFLAKLMLENFTDLAGNKASLLVMKAQDALETSCFSTSEHRSGALLGLAGCLGAQSQSGRTESRVHVSSLHERLMLLYDNTSSADQSFQPVCICLAQVTSNGFLANSLDKDKVDKTLVMFDSHLAASKESAGLNTAIGMLCYSLELGGLLTIGDFKQTLYSNWLKSVTDINNPPLERIASLTGMMAICGSERTSLFVDLSTFPSTSEVIMDEVIKCANSLMNSSDFGIQGNTSWLLGNIHMSALCIGHSANSVPASYSYLKQSSVLRAVVDYIIQAGKQGPEYVHSKHVAVCMKSLQVELSSSLPPLNWTGVLSPLMRLPFDDEVKLLCLKQAVKICSVAPTAALFMASWIVPPLFNTLSVSNQTEILESCGHFVKNVTPTVMQTFIEKTCKPVFSHRIQEEHAYQDKELEIQQDKCVLLQMAAFKGLNSALMVTDPPESMVAMLYQSVTQIFDMLLMETNSLILAGLGECMSKLPESVLDQLTAGDCTEICSINRGTVLRCYLVGNGYQPIALLNSCIDAILNNECDKEKCLNYLISCLYKMTLTKRKTAGVMAQMQWLVEIIGHCRNICTGAVKLSDSVKDFSKVTVLVVDIIMAAVSVWTSKTAPTVLGLNADIFCNPFESDNHGISRYHMTQREPTDWLKFLSPAQCLQTCVQHLMEEPWIQILTKILDWLLGLQELSDNVLSSNIKCKLAETLNSLRHSNEFGKSSIWTKAVLLPRTTVGLTM